MAAGSKVLKLDIVVDENGNAARRLTDLETGVKKVEAAAGGGLKGALDATKAGLSGTAAEAQALSGGLVAVESAAGLSAASMIGLTAGMTGVLAVAGAAGAAIYALSGYLKDSTQYYIEQSGVLEVNQQSVEHLKDTWYDLQYIIGEVIVGGDGDFRGWITLVEEGMVTIGLKVGANILLLRQLAKYAANPTSALEDATGLSDDPGAIPGIDTTMRNPDGSLTPFGIKEKQRRRAMDPDATGADPLGLNAPEFNPAIAEAMTLKQISEEKRAQLELEREQKREARERFQLLQEHVKLENDATSAIQRSKEALDSEIEAARKLNETKIESLDLSMRDAVAKASMSGGDYNAFSRNAAIDRKIAAIDTRASNADELRRRYEAERALGNIQQQQGVEGFTQGIADELHAFQIQYSDIIGELPAAFQAIIPQIQTASGQMRDAMTGDLTAVQGAQQQTIAGYVQITNAATSAADVVRMLEEADRAYRDAGLFVQQSSYIDIYRMSRSRGFAEGGLVEPGGLSRRPGPSDTVPAMLTPGEGVLSRTGMAALEKLNAGGFAPRGGGVTVAPGAVVVDARGAQFQDDAAIERLADRVQQKLQMQFTRFGGG
jgi:hypothetical protein